VRAHLRRAHLTGTQWILEAEICRLDTKNYATWVEGKRALMFPKMDAQTPRAAAMTGSCPLCA
jgi:hypothetical protein